MMRTNIFWTILVVGACSSSVDLQLETDERVEPDPGSTGDDDAGDDGSTGEPTQLWPIADLPDVDVSRVVWTAEGHLLAASFVADPRTSSADPPPWTSTLTRYDGDGVELWSSEESGTARPVPRFTAFTGTAGGGAIAAITPTGERNGPELPVVLRTYDASGAVIATRELAATDTSDAVILVSDIVATDDGGFLLAGVERDGTGPGFLARFDASGERTWTVPITYVGDDFEPGEYRFASISEVILGLTFTADQGIVFHGRYHGDVTVGDCAAENASVRQASAAYVARVELDGTCSWLETVLDRDPDSDATASNTGIGVASDGHILFVGASWSGQVLAGDLQLDEEVSHSNDYYVVELDAAGSVVGLNVLRHAQETIDGFYNVYWGDATVRGDHLVTAGRIEKFTVFPPLVYGSGESYVATYDRQGNVIDQIRTGTAAIPDESGGRANTLAFSSTGRLALGGIFLGEADFGAGPVRTESNDNSIEPYLPNGFIAVYDSPGVD